VFEVLQSGSKPLEDLLSNSDGNGVQTTSRLDLEIANLVLADMVTPENALAHSLDARELAKRLGVDQK
jgi:hypothetical protein